MRQLYCDMCGRKPESGYREVSFTESSKSRRYGREFRVENEKHVCESCYRELLLLLQERPEVERKLAAALQRIDDMERIAREATDTLEGAL